MMRHSILWAAALLLAVSCGGGITNYDGPYQAVDGLYTIPVKGETIQLAEIPAGTFTMGETLDMGRYRTPAVHQVILDGFAIGTTEVSQALWKAVMGSNPSPKETARRRAAAQSMLCLIISNNPGATPANIGSSRH